MTSAGRILFVAPVLPIDVRAVARILEESRLLYKVVTRFAPGRRFSSALAKLWITRGFSCRPNSPVSKNLTGQVLRADLAFYITRVLTGSRIEATDHSFAMVDRAASRRVRDDLAAVLGREDCCKRTFDRSRKLGVQTIYVLPTAYWRTVRTLMAREAAKFPGICRAVADQEKQSTCRLERKDTELELADHVLCPSSFVKDSLQSARLTPNVKVIPFGSEINTGDDRIHQRRPMFLYVGNITMRKGVHRLLAAWKKLRAYRTHELRLIGEMFLQKSFLQDYQGMFTHVPWLPREELQRHYREAFGFVFNTVADGFGYVLLEAMAYRVPVIASRNSGAPDIIQDGIEGYLIDYGSDDQLSAAVDRALSHPTDWLEIGQAGFRRANQWQWPDYAKEFLGWLNALN